MSLQTTISAAAAPRGPDRFACDESLVLPAGAEVDRHRIEGVLGRRGLAVVYEATQRSLHRRVALKLLTEVRGDADLQMRFRREALLQASLNHPNIVDTELWVAEEHLVASTPRHTSVNR